MKKIDFCTLSPDKLFGIDFGKDCCAGHDMEYRRKVLTRKEVDLIFRNCIELKYIKSGKVKMGWIVSRIYYLFVWMFGWIWWKT